MPRSPSPHSLATLGEADFRDALARLGEVHEREVAGLRVRNAELAALVRRLSREFSQVQAQNLQIRAPAWLPQLAGDPEGELLGASCGGPRASRGLGSARPGGDPTEGLERAGTDVQAVDEIDLDFSPETISDAAGVGEQSPDARAGRTSNISCVSSVCEPTVSSREDSVDTCDGVENRRVIVIVDPDPIDARKTMASLSTTRSFPNSCMRRGSGMSSQLQRSPSDASLSLYTLREAWQVSDPKLVNLRKRRTKSKALVSSSSGKRLSVNHWMSKKSMSGLFDHNGGVLKRVLTLQNYVVHPQSRKRVLSNLLGMIFVLYDLFIIPMQLFDLPPSPFQSRMRWTVAIFWTLDIAFSFFTGVYDQTGQLQMKPAEVAKQYAKTWLFFDIVVLVLEWVFIGLGEGTSSDVAGGGGMIYLRVLRFLRFLRLMRVVRLERAMMDVRERINSSYVLIFIGLFRVIIGIIILNHILACIWFGIGQTNDGWASDFHHPHGEIPEFTLLYGYLTAVHWAVTQFHGTMEVFPKNTQERGFSVIVVLSALLGFSSFLSTITNMMRQLQIIHDERTREQQLVRKFLRDNHISARLGVRVKKFVECKQAMHQMQEADVEVLKMLPGPMLMDLHEEMRSLFLEKHPFFVHFREMFGRIVRRVCHEAMHPTAGSYGEIIFTTGDACVGMYFVTSGSLAYERGADAEIDPTSSARMTVGSAEAIEQMHKRRLGESQESRLGGGSQAANKQGLTRGAWLSEAALWTADWEHQGELCAVTTCQLLALDAGEFSRIVRSHGTAMGAAVDYARYFLNFLNDADAVLSDVMCDFPSLEACQSLIFEEEPRSSIRSRISGFRISKHGFQISQQT